MRRIVLILVTVAVGLLVGCQPGPGRSDDDLIVIEFRPDEPLTYRLTSRRDILIELMDGQGNPQPGQSHKMSERLDVVMTYTATEVDPVGLTTLQAHCDSAKVTRQGFRTSGPEPKDLAEKLAGQTFTFQVSPSGKPADTGAMDAALNTFIESVFANRSGPVKRIKDPEMVVDFLALQYHLWDSVATMEDPLGGARVGKQWTCEQLTPLPFPLPFMRSTTYTLRELDSAGRKAVIESTFALSNKEPDYWLPTYKEPFNLRGSLFAILRNYRSRSIDGQGQVVFDVDEGTLESEVQTYKTVLDASFMLPLGNTRPVVTIDQELSATRVVPDGA